MRIVYLPVIMLMAGITPAIAGTDAGDAPNPFTDPEAGQPGGAIPGRALDDVAVPAQLPIPSAGQAGGLTPPADEAKSSGTFYQAQKKDTDGH